MPDGVRVEQPWAEASVRAMYERNAGLCVSPARPPAWRGWAKRSGPLSEPTQLQSPARLAAALVVSTNAGSIVASPVFRIAAP